MVTPRERSGESPQPLRPQPLAEPAGTVETNRAMKLRSTVVLDQEFATGRASGTRGTPSAVLVDAEGRIAFEPAVGAPAVLALAKGEGPRVRTS
jgi:hypothetical protein